jgi:hypothetical protein
VQEDGASKQFLSEEQHTCAQRSAARIARSNDTAWIKAVDLRSQYDEIREHVGLAPNVTRVRMAALAALLWCHEPRQAEHRCIRRQRSSSFKKVRCAVVGTTNQQQRKRPITAGNKPMGKAEIAQVPCAHALLHIPTTSRIGRRKQIGHPRFVNHVLLLSTRDNTDQR